MGKYRVTERSFIDNRLVEAGEEIEFNGIPGKNLEPMDKDGKKSAELLADANKESATRQRDAAAGADINDPEYQPGIADVAAQKGNAMVAA